MHRIGNPIQIRQGNFSLIKQHIIQVGSKNLTRVSSDLSVTLVPVMSSDEQAKAQRIGRALAQATPDLRAMQHQTQQQAPVQRIRISNQPDPLLNVKDVRLPICHLGLKS